MGSNTAVAAMKGKLGSTDYFVIVMKAEELVNKVRIPKEIPGWDNVPLEEREQRDIDYKRVKNTIAPYFATDSDRFFGSIIVTVQGLDKVKFEPLEDIKDVPEAYKNLCESLGFLHFKGSELWFPLDGQHRLKAIKFAIDGNDEEGLEITKFSSCRELAQEDVTVIIIPHDKKKSRKIFTRVNSYAKKTSKGENLVTDDECFIAISARKIANNLDIIGPDLVTYKKNDLNDGDGDARYFTTLAAIADCNQAILDAHFPGVGHVRPVKVEDAGQRDLYQKKIDTVWKHLTKNIEKFSDILADTTTNGNDKRQEIRKTYLLGKPAPQICLFKAFVRLINTHPNGFSPSEASAALNKIDWRKDAKLWDRLLMLGSRIVPKNKPLASRIIYYVAGGHLDKEGKDSLLKDYKKIFPPEEQDKIDLPKKVG